MDESVDALITKVKALGAVNEGIIDTIEDTPEEMVVTAWTHTFKLVVTEGCGGPSVKVEATAQKAPIRPRIDGWVYPGEPLDIPDDMFNDKLNYDIKTFQDVKDLNEGLVRVAKKYARLADVRANRDDLRMFLTNLERLQVALGQIQRLTMDMEDRVSESPSMLKAERLAKEMADCLSETFDEYYFEVDARCGKGKAKKKKKKKQIVVNVRRTFDEEKVMKEMKESFGVESLDIEELNMSVSGLKSIPDSIGVLTNLKKLDLHWNQLSSIPDSIGSLTKLTGLWLSENQLSRIPDSIGSLTNLTILGLYSNQLSIIPDSIGSLTNLTELGLNKNQLSRIPDSIGSLTNLTELWLHENRLTSIPDSIGSLTNLTELWLYKNQLSSIPDSIGSLTNLTALKLNENQLSSIPDSIGSLTNLSIMTVSDQKSGVKLSRPPLPSSCQVYL